MKRLAACGVVAAAVVGACEGDESSSTSRSTGSGLAGGTGVGGSVSEPACGQLGETFATAECGDCAEANCCDALTVCDDNAACVALLDCRAGCTDQACADACAQMHDGGTDDLAALEACIAESCQSSCPTSTGICDTGLTLGDAACDECLGDHCCAQLNACLDEANCSACVDGGGTDCDDDPTFQDVGACFMTSCSDVCSG